MFTLGYSLIYLTVLYVGEQILHPLRSKYGADFPNGAYTRWLINEIYGFYYSAAHPPFDKPNVYNFNQKTKSYQNITKKPQTQAQTQKHDVLL